MFGTDVDGGKARRECGADARWREPDFTQCIDSKSSIDIASFPGPTQLSATDGGLGTRLPLTHVASFPGPTQLSATDGGLRTRLPLTHVASFPGPTQLSATDGGLGTRLPLTQPCSQAPPPFL